MSSCLFFCKGAPLQKLTRQRGAGSQFLKQVSPQLDLS